MALKIFNFFSARAEPPGGKHGPQGHGGGRGRADISLRCFNYKN